LIQACLPFYNYARNNADLFGQGKDPLQACQAPALSVPDKGIEQESPFLPDTTRKIKPVINNASLGLDGIHNSYDIALFV
jgi:hypothetical protein